MAKDVDGALESDIHDFHHLVASGDAEGLKSALESPELYRSACDDRGYQELALRGVSVLAWDDPNLASELLLKFDFDNERENSGSLAHRSATSLMAAMDWRSMETRDPELYSGLSKARALFRSAGALGMGDAAGFEQHAATLRESLQTAPERFLVLADQISESYPFLGAWIRQLRPLHCEGLAELLRALSKSIPWRGRFYAATVLCALAVVFLPFGVGFLAALGICTLQVVVREGVRYRQRVRAPLARILAESGASPQDVVDWLYTRGRDCAALRRFDVMVENDDGLAVFAGIARLSRHP